MANKDFKKYWSMVLNKDKKKAEILIYEQIGAGFWEEGIGAKQFAKDLKELGDIDDLDVRINSPGGSVFEGLTIYNLLKQHSAEKTVYIDGLAASIASVIAMSGDIIVMPENATMMIHNPWSLAIGDADAMRKEADVLDKIKVGIVSAYRDKTGKTDEDLSSLMDAETWMTAAEAVEMGFADEMTKSVKAAAMAFDLSKFKNVPKAITAQAAVDAHSTAPSGAGEKPAGSAPAGKQAAAHAADTPPVPSPSAAGNSPRKEKKTMSVPCKKCGSPVNETGDCPACEAKLQAQAAVEQARRAEVERCSEVRALAKEFRMDSMGDVAVAEGWSVEQTRTAILAKIKSTSDPSKPLAISVTPGHEGKPFRSFGEQLIAIKNAALSPSAADPRLREVYNAPTGAGETVPADGGFLVQSDFTTALLARGNETALLVPRCTTLQVSGNGIEAPVIDESSRATGSRWGGVQLYRVNEAGQATKKKPKLAKLEMKLEKLMGLMYATDELLADAAALESVANQAFAEEFGFVADDEIVRGSGVGQPLGILNAACLVSVAKETGQLADTIEAENIVKMYSRMPARSKANAVWLINSECIPQLLLLSYKIGATAVPLYMPPGGLSQQPYGTIFGRPVIEIEQAAALGDVGDIMFVDLTQYARIEKGGINAAQSIHVQFLTDEMTFRWTTRNNGQPIWKSSLTPYKADANFKVSPFVTLAERA